MLAFLNYYTIPDTSSGIFSLNYVFNNGTEKETVTETIELLPEKGQEIKTKVPLYGDV
jgi:hypothetical protein